MVNDTVREQVPDMTAFISRPADSMQEEPRDSSFRIDSYASATIAPEAAPRLPHRVPGGLKGVGEDLERHAREWRNTYRLMEQQRPILEATEAERDRLQEVLNRVVPRVNDSTRALSSAIDMARKGDFSGDLSAQFTKNLAALDDLEAVAESLTANLLQMRASWEQYARTVLRAQALREKVK
jgi:hypothetical protein